MNDFRYVPTARATRQMEEKRPNIMVIVEMFFVSVLQFAFKVRFAREQEMYPGIQCISLKKS